MLEVHDISMVFDMMWVYFWMSAVHGVCLNCKARLRYQRVTALFFWSPSWGLCTLLSPEGQQAAEQAIYTWNYWNTFPSLCELWILHIYIVCVCVHVFFSTRRSCETHMADFGCSHCIFLHISAFYFCGMCSAASVFCKSCLHSKLSAHHAFSLVIQLICRAPTEKMQHRRKQRFGAPAHCCSLSTGASSQVCQSSRTPPGFKVWERASWICIVLLRLCSCLFLQSSTSAAMCTRSSRYT